MGKNLHVPDKTSTDRIQGRINIMKSLLVWTKPHNCKISTWIALIIGIDRILDMTRTAVNVTGDAAISCVVASSENKLKVKL